MFDADAQVRQRRHASESNPVLTLGTQRPCMQLRQTTEETEDASEDWFGRAKAKYGLGALLVVAGVALFLLPEPITSTAGIALIAAGALVWLVGRFR